MCSENENHVQCDGLHFLKKGNGTVSVCMDSLHPIQQKREIFAHLGTEITVPEYIQVLEKYKVTELGFNSFDYADKMEVLNLPGSISAIEWSFFECNKLREIHVDSQNESFCDVDGVVYSKDKSKIIIYPPAYPEEEYHILPSTRKIAKFCFKTALNLKTLYIPESVREIDINAFYGCLALEHVYIEGALKNVQCTTPKDREPKKAVFHYQNKNLSFKELRKEVSQRNQ